MCAYACGIYCSDTNVWKLVEVSGESPLGTTPTYCSAGEKLIVFGGIYDGVPLNSVHMLDTGEPLLSTFNVPISGSMCVQLFTDVQSSGMGVQRDSHSKIFVTTHVLCHVMSLW